MKKHLYIILLILPLIGFGQGWEQTFGGEDDDWGNSVQQTLDGGYIITGSTRSFETIDKNIYLIKTNENGDEEWSQNYEVLVIDNGNSVQQTSDGGYIISGHTRLEVTGDYDICLIKTDSNGNDEWIKTFGGDGNEMGFEVKQTFDGGYIVVGYTTSFSNESDVYIIKTDSNGNIDWSQIYGGNNWDSGKSVQQTLDGGYIITGYTNISEEDKLYLLKISENGNEEWSQNFGISNYDRGNYVQQTLDGGYIILGYNGNPFNTSYLIKTDENGDEEWFQNLEGILSSFEVKQTLDGGYIVFGNKLNDLDGYDDLCILKTDGNGNEEWSQTFGGIWCQDSGYSGQQTLDEGYITTGFTYNDFSGYMDVYLIKTDSQGNLTFTTELPTPTSKRELVKTTNILGQENTTIKNQPLIEIYDDGSVDKKYIIE